MLSAYKAQPLVEFKQRDKSKIESVLVHDDRLLVGLYSGSLRVYRINEPEGADSEQGKGQDDKPRPASRTGYKSVDLMREQEKFSKYKIEHLACVKEADILLSLSNGYVHLHGLQDYNLRETLQKTKGATTFAVTTHTVKDASSGVAAIVSRLAVAVKRRLILWVWHDGDLNSETSEISLATGIKTLVWATDTKLIAGLTSSYVMVDVTNSAVTDIVGPGSIGGAPGQDGGRFGGAGVAGMGYLGLSAPTPLATKLAEGEILLAKDINTHFIDADARPLGRRQIPWAVAPEAICYANPYLLALQTAKGALEVRNPETSTLLQTIILPTASRLHIPQCSKSSSYAGTTIIVIGDRTIWSAIALDFDPQIDTLIERGSLDEAISLIQRLSKSSLEDKEGKMREVKMLKAKLLFDQCKFRESIDLFSDVSAPPERVIALYPPFIAGDTSVKSRDHARVAIRRGSSAASSISSPPEIDKREATSSVGHDGDTADSSGNPIDKPLEGKDLKVATEELRGLLVSARTKLKRVLNENGSLNDEGLELVTPAELAALLGKKVFEKDLDKERLYAIARLVDTTLFRAYMFVSPSFAGPLFRIDNFCDPDVVNEKLIEAGRYNDLVDFFYGKKLHRQALELLRRFGDSSEDEGLAPQLAGPGRTVGYLKTLQPEMIDLILQFVDWPLRSDPELGMDVFLADTENAETLPRDRVLGFLQRIDSKLAVRYLEHIIHELNDTTPDFHQKLVEIYIEGLKDAPFNGEEERLDWYEKTMSFLRGSRFYQAYKALNHLDQKDPRLYEARAIVLSNMGQYRQALDIYVFRLKDADKAEEYCNQIYSQENHQQNMVAFSDARTKDPPDADPDEGPPTIYHTLLSLYLSPPAPHKPQWGPALKILAKHGARVPASSTLKLIPETLPVQDLESYFRGRVRAANTVVNEGRIVAGLRSTLSFAEEAKLRLGEGVAGGNEGRNRRAVITENRVCGMCHKRFGGSAIKILPTNVVVHYGCSARP